ncbi:hypothetical protein CKAN_00569200 [Cinnamomum micranthum f. kanehirae]|uniref:CRM domain-containing protein n=1 Tax=Cinnamomum micranthum f. kanehirae TaxID=337451 RepID=A0A3S4NH99_9MAGN|nr:hypothetical protein CKAN_00569200 [Cinnamomum micranthum f. kanehirae]
MWALRNIQRHCFRAISHTQNRSILLQNVSLHLQASNFNKSGASSEGSVSSFSPLDYSNGSRFMSTTRGRSMRSKVENRMRRETGKTLRERRRAKKLEKKVMTHQQRLIYNLRRAKKKVALLLQKLKKYELPELPAPRHDPELLTPEQLQAYKKIGFRNRNYVPVGVRGVFGGVVQNMHLHWKFHETVQVCCDNFPKEKIKEMATMLARLSGGIVVNVHDVKTIIMFRGRNYRQPKNLIPLNTLTKRKALFKARFEQALDSQKLNIKKIEQELRRDGVNPEDPVAMANIERVASTFFRAIDEKQGTPYVYHGNQRNTQAEKAEDSVLSGDSDQEELDRFIADIEDAADQEWAAEEAAEKQELGKIRYWNREEIGARGRRTQVSGSENSEDETCSGGRDRRPMRGKQRTTDIRRWDSDDEKASAEEGDSDDVQGISDLESDAESSNDELRVSRKVKKWKNIRADHEGASVRRGSGGWRGNSVEQDSGSHEGASVRSGSGGWRGNSVEQDSGSHDLFGDSDGGLWESDGEGKLDGRALSERRDFDYYSGSDEESELNNKDIKGKKLKTKKQIDEIWDSD